MQYILAGIRCCMRHLALPKSIKNSPSTRRPFFLCSRLPLPVLHIRLVDLFGVSLVSNTNPSKSPHVHHLNTQTSHQCHETPHWEICRSNSLFLKAIWKKQPKFRFVTLAFLWRTNQTKHLMINLHVLHDYYWVMPAPKKLCSGGKYAWNMEEKQRFQSIRWVFAMSPMKWNKI